MPNMSSRLRARPRRHARTAMYMVLARDGCIQAASRNNRHGLTRGIQLTIQPPSVTTALIIAAFVQHGVAAFGEGLRIDGTLLKNAPVMAGPHRGVFLALRFVHLDTVGKHPGPQAGADMHVESQRGGAAIAPNLSCSQHVGAKVRAAPAIFARDADPQQTGGASGSRLESEPACRFRRHGRQISSGAEGCVSEQLQVEFGHSSPGSKAGLSCASLIH